MEKSKLFQSLHIGHVELKHRIAMASLTRFRAGEDHIQLPIAVDYYAQRASVPGTLIIAEATLISPAHGGVPNAPALWNDTHIAGWRKITDAVHAKGSYILCQLIAPGRAASADTLMNEGGHDLLSSSAVALPASAALGSEDIMQPPTPREMTDNEIKSCIADFSQAGRNAIAAGFDGVEIHGANGYLVDQFLQDTCNKRTDSWGGSIENRARFGIKVAAALVDAIGADRVGFRISPWSPFQGMRMDDPVPQFSYLVSKLKELHLAYLHVIESRVNNNVDCEKNGGIDFVLDIWDNLTPVLVAGGFDPTQAFKAVDEEYKKFNVVIVFGRHFLANPDLPFRVEHGLDLNIYDRSTFYSIKEPKGYLDYPFSDRFSLEAAL